MGKRKILSLIIKFVVTYIFIIVLGFVSYYYIFLGTSNKEKIAISYNSNSDVTYKVYLKKNNFFTEPYLEMDRTYIASLIDHIDALFVYNMDYSSLVSGEYSYYIKATIMANKSNSTRGNSTNYWEKSYNLTEPETIKIDSQKSFIVSKSISVNYQEYSDLLAQFRKEYGLSIDGFLQLEMVINSKVNGNEMAKDVVVESADQLTIPLTEQAIELSIEKNTDSDSGVVSDIIKLTDKKYTVFLIVGIVLAAVDALMLIVMFIVVVMVINSKSLYVKELKKIKATYDSILVNVNKVPDLSDLNVIHVDSFQELIDAHSEVRMPINFVEEEHDTRSVFVLINDKIACFYVLEDENVEHKKKVNSKKKR